MIDNHSAEKYVLIKPKFTRNLNDNQNNNPNSFQSPLRNIIQKYIKLYGNEYDNIIDSSILKENLKVTSLPNGSNNSLEKYEKESIEHDNLNNPEFNYPLINSKTAKVLDRENHHIVSNVVRTSYNHWKWNKTKKKAKYKKYKFSHEGSFSSITTQAPHKNIKREIRTYETVFKIINYIFLFIIIFSNTMVIMAYSKFQKLRSITNRFVISLAVADLCVGLSRSSQEILEFIDPTSESKPYAYRCLLFGTFPTTMNVASLLSLLGVTIDRYISVVNPLRYNSIMREKLANSIIVSAWGTAFFIIFIVPHFFYIKPGRGFCNYPYLYKYLLITYSILYVTILLIISLFYAKIFYECHKHLLQTMFSDNFSQRVTSQNAAYTQKDLALQPVTNEDRNSLESASSYKTENDYLQHHSSLDSRTQQLKPLMEEQNVPADLGDAVNKIEPTNLPNIPAKAATTELHSIIKRTEGLTKNEQTNPLLDKTNPIANSSHLSRPLLKTRTVSINDEQAKSNLASDNDQKSLTRRDSSSSKKINEQYKRRESAGVIIASKTTIMIAIIVGTFALLGLPLQIVEYILVFNSNNVKNLELFFIVHGVCVLLYYLNSAVNPYIYAWKNSDFRDGFKQILTCSGIFAKDNYTFRHLYGDPRSSHSSSVLRMSRMFSFLGKNNDKNISTHKNNNSFLPKSPPRIPKTDKNLTTPIQDIML
ncbi:D(2) dopamine receptor A-like isoform X3 [Gordionus sp. m RMFG-2023]|uniref:D(2) dopamine receptor A-like isoform X3 n=1 Tax=Gordionus sp. m RMFG-2023 TaxID=3053472 RepID=UPI0031FE3EA2